MDPVIKTLYFSLLLPGRISLKLNEDNVVMDVTVYKNSIPYVNTDYLQNMLDVMVSPMIVINTKQFRLFVEAGIQGYTDSVKRLL